MKVQMSLCSVKNFSFLLKSKILMIIMTLNKKYVVYYLLVIRKRSLWNSLQRKTVWNWWTLESYQKNRKESCQQHSTFDVINLDYDHIGSSLHNQTLRHFRVETSHLSGHWVIFLLNKLLWWRITLWQTLVRRNIFRRDCKSYFSSNDWGNKLHSSSTNRSQRS